MSDTIEIKDGDIFRWRWKDAKRNADHLTYWAKSCICVAKNGRLLDTFSNYDPVLVSTYEEASDKLELTYVGNFADLEQKPEYMAEYYDAADCVNINHSNSSKGNFYVRIGTKRSADKMRETIRYKIEKEESAIRCAQWHIECLKKELAKLDDKTVPLDQVHVS